LRFKSCLILRSLHTRGPSLVGRISLGRQVRDILYTCRWTLLYARVRVSAMDGERPYASTRLRAFTRDGKSGVARTCARRAILICRFQGRLNPRLTPEYNNSWVQWRASKRNSDGRPRDVVRVFRLLRRLAMTLIIVATSRANKIV